MTESSGRDPLCPTNPNDDPNCWFCAKVRADEREQVWAEATFLVLTHRDMTPNPSDARGRLDRLLLDVASRHDAVALLPEVSE